MLKLELDIIINACERLLLKFDDRVSVKQIANEIIRIYKFPRESNFKMEIDNMIREPSFILNKQPFNPIKANFDFVTSVTFKGKFNLPFQHRIDLCKQTQQISNQIMNMILPIEYSVYIPVENGNKPYINSYQEIPKIIEFDIQANFYINFQGIHHQFNVHPFGQIEEIKYEILAFFTIKEVFQLFYNDIELNDQQQYITYLIPDHSELKIKLQTRIKLLVRYQDTVHQFSSAFTEKLGSFKQKLRQLYQVSDKHQLQLIYQNNVLKNDQECIYLMIMENSIIEMQVGKKYSLTLQDKDSSEKFQFQVRSIDLVSMLDKQHPFINKQVTYEFQGQKLRKEETFEQLQVDIDNKTIYYQIEKQKINVQFQDDFSKQQKVEVITTEPIRIALQQFNKGNLPITITYGGKNISIDSTYEKEAIVNDSIIVYKVNDRIQIKYTVAPNCVQHGFQIPRDMNGAQLLKVLSQNHSQQGQQYKLMLNNFEFPSNQPVIKDQCYRLVRTFEMLFLYEKNDQPYQEVFSQEDKIYDAKQKISQVFNIPIDSLIILCKDLALKEDFLLNQYKDKTLVISQAIRISFQKRNGSATIQKYYQKSLRFKDIFKDFFKEQQSNPCRFQFNQQVVDENKFLKEICKDDLQIALTYELQSNLKLINKDIQTEIQRVQFYPSDIIGSVFSRYLGEQFFYLFNGQKIDIQKSFEELKILNNSNVLYFQLHKFTIQILTYNTNLEIQIDSLKYKIKDVISSKIKEKYADDFTASYNNRQLDLEKTFIQEKLMGGANIQCSLIRYLQVIVHENEFSKTYMVYSNICVGQLLKMLDNFSIKKTLITKDQKQLENNILLSSLKNNDGIVELIYKELVSAPDTIYQPSGSMSCFNQTQNLKTTESSQLDIVIHNINNDQQIFETVKLDQKLGDFIKDFEIKMEFSGITLFYEGVAVDYNKTFEEIGAKSDSSFEIIC